MLSRIRSFFERTPERRMTMKFGIFPCTQDPPRGEHIDRVFDEIVAEAQAAEAVGFDSCLITEHHQQ
ncbi:MAG: LLM class flavin-dependent oxidoreductase, partial [Dehalococcoidia bacterium]